MYGAGWNFESSYNSDDCKTTDFDVPFVSTLKMKQKQWEPLQQATI